MADGQWTKGGTPVVVLGADAGFSEQDHPRAENGQFGSGGGGSSSREGNLGAAVQQALEEYKKKTGNYPNPELAKTMTESLQKVYSKSSGGGSSAGGSSDLPSGMERESGGSHSRTQKEIQVAKNGLREAKRKGDVVSQRKLEEKIKRLTRNLKKAVNA